jgi:hypothetical protein
MTDDRFTKWWSATDSGNVVNLVNETDAISDF